MGKHKVPEATELDLTPIMNMVMVLIPMMLLSVVFTAIHVIDVTMPQRSAGSAQNDVEKPKRLQLFISKQGFTILKNDQKVEPTDKSCVTSICPNNPNDEIETKRHNWVELYNKLREIKLDEEWKEHETIEIVGDAAINFGVLVKAMDISRCFLADEGSSEKTGNSMSSESQLGTSHPVLKEGSEDCEPMFPAVVLGMPTVSQ